LFLDRFSIECRRGNGSKLQGTFAILLDQLTIGIIVLTDLMMIAASVSVLKILTVVCKLTTRTRPKKAPCRQG
jgi:hypothetical protein